MKNYIKYVAGLLVCGALVSSCESRLDITNPNNFNDEQINELLKNGTDKQREMILGGLAAGLRGKLCMRDGKMSGGFSNMNIDNEWIHGFDENIMLADMVYGTSAQGASSWNIIYYRNDGNNTFWDQNIAFDYGQWVSGAYKVNEANKVLQFLPDDNVGDNKLLKGYAAMAYTLRAFGYMQLMERFTKDYLHGGKEGRGVPIYTEYKYNDPVAPSTAEECWAFVKADLTKAISYYKDSKIGVGGYTVPTGVEATDNDNAYDLDCGVAQYLMARLCLQTGDYAGCISACQDLLSKFDWKFITEDHYGVNTSRMQGLCTRVSDSEDDINNYQDEAPANKNAFTFIPVNPEVIFGWATNANNYTWYFLNSLCSSGGGQGEGWTQIDKSLYDQIAPTDFRKSRFTDQVYTFPYYTMQGKTRVEKPKEIPALANLKFAATYAKDAAEDKRDNNKAGSDEVFIRTSEVVLMLAEAQAASGSDAAAKTTLNKLLAARTVAGEPALTCDNYPSMQGKSAMDMVKLQWRIEMWGEQGVDWRNNKRWNNQTTRQGSNHWAKEVVKLDHMTFEIPYKETSTNPNW